MAIERERVVDLTEQRRDLASELSATQLELGEAENLAAARGRVLAQTRRVLRRVDPLLSTVDELQLLAAQIQDQRDSFGSIASSLIEEFVAFTNYILDTDPFYYDFGYLSSEIDYLNAGLNDVRDASSRLNARDDDYQRVTRRFERRATAYTVAVRRLQKALAEVTG